MTVLMCSHGFPIEQPCEHCTYDALQRVPESMPVREHGATIYNTAIDHALAKLRLAKTVSEAVAAVKGLRK